MAKKQVVRYSYTCDVCGDAIPDGESHGVGRIVAWDGNDYVVDVCNMHSSDLDEVMGALKRFVDAGHRSATRRVRRRAAEAAAPPPVARPPRPAPTPTAAAPTAGRDLPAIRSWAQASGFSIGVRGRIPATVIEAYDAAQAAPAGAQPAPAPTRRARKVGSSQAAATAQASARKGRPRKAAASR